MEQSGSLWAKLTTPPGPTTSAKKTAGSLPSLVNCVHHFRRFDEGFSYREMFRGATPICQRYRTLCYDID